MAISKTEISQSSNITLTEFENIILWSAFKDQPNGSYEQITDLGSFYNIPLDRKLIVQLCEKLGKQRLLKYKSDPNSIQVKLTQQGQEYVSQTLRAKITEQKAIPIGKIRQLIRSSKHAEDFEISEHDNKESYSVDYAPDGKFSNYFFRFTRIRFLFYRVDCDPVVPLINRIEFEAILEAFQKWMAMVIVATDDNEQNNVPKATQKRSSSSIWLVGSDWKGVEQVDHFLSHGIWEAGYDNQHEFAEIKVGDTLILKSTFSKDEITYLRIKALGNVVEKRGHVAAVNWTVKNIALDIENLGFYRKTIEQAKADDFRLIDERMQRHLAKNMRVKLQLDTVSETDKLNRMPFVDALADYIDRLWGDQENQAYTIHLTGEWGSGKSNVLKFLNEELNVRGWKVLHYNAWENQHIENPWWLFWNKVYKQISSKLSLLERLRFQLKEFWWRLVVINKLNWISFLFITTIGALIIWFQSSRSSTSSDRSMDLFTIVGSVVSIGGSVWLLFKGISMSLLPASDDAAQMFQKNINDPIELLKKHFNSMVLYPGKPVAIFIDDIDRCSSKNVVRLLEGIQTTFKSAKVLYVFAGDSSWVRRCFEIEYSDFLNDFNKPGHTLGNFFVEKVFQMSVKVPPVSKESLRSYFRSTLHDSIGQTEKQNNEAIKLIAQEVSYTRTERDLEDLLKRHRGTPLEQEAIKKVVAHLSTQDTQATIEHELESYCELLPSNIRSIKRFVNNYALSRQTLLLQGVSFADIPMDVLVRWLIITSHFPITAEGLLREPHLITDPKSGLRSVIDSDAFQNISSGKITEEKINLLAGRK